MSLSASDKVLLEEAFKLHESAPGQLSAASLPEVVRIVGANPSDETLQNFSGSKTVFSMSDVESFLASQPLHEDPTKTLGDAFAMFDVDGTGKIDASEFRTVLSNLGERFRGHEIEEMMRITEVDNDGKLEYKDFIKFAADHK
ncbi:hypothetical protein PTSG_13185 [Salpingoeca rosetta]|uniref:EF-hand domain-containing protein n=1 Tax=Salpingoeca rosetta (strain ATCC 50818 / BSB-021) TaxID=946362 RepID=F2UTA4_SALR5|nr:uncharacterized protein PTSG_13185 [Salpingoeca rosetta]EGD81860.1 hypothetical protein PTSG_13185 [Salpingoeca rosetta]|eukprot:XP_004987601.1 hypothetical protein PTSG_13185 [Salpingoeca rosetta]